MGKAIIDLKIGINRERGLVGLKFPRPTIQLELPAINALELARQLITAARECDEHRKLSSMLKEISGEVQ